MCGIVGHLGKFNALDAVLNGLEHLEYRGYDSAGIAYAVENQIFISKEKEEKSIIDIEDRKGLLDIAVKTWKFLVVI